MRVPASLAVLAIALCCGEAQAQDCAEGRARTEDGYCCWPGQRFSADRNRCEGPPDCPEALVAHGAECAAPVAATPSVAASYATLALPDPSAAPAPASYAGTAEWPVTHEADVLHHAVRSRGEDGGLVTTALVIFDVGWSMGIVGAAIDEAFQPCGDWMRTTRFSCGSGALALVPLGGGIAAVTMSFSGGSRWSLNWGFAFGVQSVIVQGAGLIALVIALANEVDDVGTIPLGDVTLVPTAGPPGSDIGAGVGIAW
ncbi:MAG: hypothetical protein U0234_02870 [Sandaracinus sp.]